MDTITTKKTGSYYTPIELANFLVGLSIKSENEKILDPSFGDGALLLAAYERLKKVGSSNPYSQLYGFEIHEPCKKFIKNKFSSTLNFKNLKVHDFLTVSVVPSKKFSLIIMNPPFIRHHKLHKNLKKIKPVEKWGIKQSRTSDIWAFFILHSLDFLEKNGSLAAILPWSFIQADYAKSVHEVLMQNFESIEIIVLGRRFFNQAQERVLIFHGKNFGTSNKHFSLGYSYEIPKTMNFLRRIDNKRIQGLPWNSLSSYGSEKVLKNLKKKIPIKTLEDFADIRIGSVTGANSFFIVDRTYAQENKLSKSILKPIITNSREFKTLSINSTKKWEKFLLIIPESMKIEGKLSRYIQDGEKQGLDTRYHTKKRDVWYSIPPPKKPDAFLQYMTKGVPYIILNQSRILSTNSVHQIFFNKKIDLNTKKWIQLSMFTSFSQLSVELLGKTYGGGVLKIEPAAAKKILVYDGQGEKFPESIEKEIIPLLAQGKREEIVDLVDDWFVHNLDLSEQLVDRMKSEYIKIRNIREK
jgi:adenine-specific DNA-methyltransferase